MDNILLKFESDNTGTDTAKEKLIEVIVTEQKLQEQAEKTNAEMTKIGDATTKGTKDSKKSVDSLATSFNQLSKINVGGTYKKTFDELRKSLFLTDQQLKQFFQNARKEAQLKFLEGGTKEELAELETIIVNADAAIAELGNTAKVTAPKIGSLRTELRQMKEEITRRTIAGETGKDIDELIAKAGQLDDALKDVTQAVSQTGSDTRNIEGFVQIIGTGVQAVAGLQAAQALLGDENEDFNKVLAKMNALLVISNSVQAIQQAILKESAAVTAITNAQRSIGVLVTKLQTAAESEYVIVRYSAIAAQRILNAVMAASPAGILLVAIGALAAAVLFFTRNTEDASAAQKKLNDEMENAIEVQERYANAQNSANDINISKMKLAGATAQQIREQELQNMKDELGKRQALEDQQRDAFDKAREIQKNSFEVGKDFDEKQLAEADKTVKAFDEISQKKLALQDAVDKKEIDNKIATKEEIEKFDDEILEKKRSDNEKAKVEGQRRIADLQAIAIKDRKAVQEIAKLQLEDQKRTREELLNNSDTPFTGKVKALQESFEISKTMLLKEKEFELENTKLTANEKKLIGAKYLSDLSKLSQENDKRMAELSKTFNTEELAAKKLAIENLRGAKINDLQKDIAGNDEILATTKLTAQQQFDIKKDTIQKIAAIGRQEFLKAGDLYAAGLITYQEYQAAVTKAATDAGKERTELFQLENDLLIKNETEKIEFRKKLQDKGFEYAQKVGQLLIANAITNIGKESDLNQRNFDNKLITENEYNAKKEQLAKKEADLKKKQAVFEIAIELAKAVFKLASEASGFIGGVFTSGLAAVPLAQIGLLIGEAAVQTALVLGAKYAEGEVNIKGKGTGTSDSIPAFISAGESVITARQTAKHEDVLRAIHNDRFEEYMMRFSTPVIPVATESWQSSRGVSNPIDYDKLGNVIGKTLADNPHVSVHVDEQGIVTLIHEGLTTTEYKNKKLIA